MEASLYWNNQEFIIKQFTPDYSSGVTTAAIVATHVYAEISRIRQYNTKVGTLTYSVSDVLSFYLDDSSCNTMGYTYQVIGNFDSAQITDLGNNSGQDMLSQIISTWPTAVIYPDNKQIRVYSSNSFGKDYGNRIDYLYDTQEVTLTYDSTEIVNSVKCFGKTVDTSSSSSDDDTDADTIRYYFDPFIVQDTDSIAKWGIHSGDDVSDERFTDANAMRIYALTQMIPEPSLSIEIKSDQLSKPIAGEVRRLEIRPMGYTTHVQVLEYQHYPFDNTQQKDVTLNNTAKTVLDYQRAQSVNLDRLITIQRTKIASLSNEVATVSNTAKTLSNATTTLSEAYKTMQATIAGLQQQVKGLQNNSGNWAAGSIFVDLSSNNGATSTTDQEASWYSNLVSKGAKGAIIKLTQGTTYTNPLFASQKANVISAGMKFIGSYHFLTSTTVAGAQLEAKYFLSKLQANSIDRNAIVACDIESDTLSKDKDTLTSMITAFYKILTDAGYSNTVDYASASWFGSRFTSVAKYKWIASYGVTTAPSGADAWQSTDNWNNLKVDASYSYNKIFV
ncbi:minor structural protein [Paucilactobacillus suebicus DSM 5007 = KCTC 3549]|uniref:Minor structural protein n=1 Tax=Paucilactobacillus suebicus DSM 5007 = KCTC 3549 TaxID=1423807 RepID=A0A0R1VVU1_9LACO|nr:minor structural protein [Paucilactobacillus suebicus DSM 5007 = KCTC 3549]